jgi:threonine dehydrogenase-like Zn-dependent dehydrogenase
VWRDYRVRSLGRPDVADARPIEPTDALVRVTRAAICRSDLWPYKSMLHDDASRRMGHEFIGVVDAIGSERPRSAPTSKNCSRMCSTAGSSPVAS